jgi:hypothetical protein
MRFYGDETTLKKRICSEKNGINELGQRITAPEVDNFNLCRGILFCVGAQLGIAQPIFSKILPSPRVPEKTTLSFRQILHPGACLLLAFISRVSWRCFAAEFALVQK